VRLDPADAARGNQWFEVLSWQGRTPGHTRQLTPLREIAPGRYVTSGRLPVTGNWKTLVRLAKGTHIMALPVYMPPSPQGRRPGIPWPRARDRWWPTPTCCSARRAAGRPG